MQSALKDKTNEKSKGVMKKKDIVSDKDNVLNFIKEVESSTKDFNLKYDLTKCIEILEGKENQEFTDLRMALEEVLLEKEQLFREKCELAVELDYLKSKEKKHKRKS
ncbi:uncharacterized protein VICG_00922 [Vittaforma corneae ATCC 50505]|uniref:Uncharacterized protein n=1 Tax=Vittaforma corneae (strain ATCC 50505) TaxID=993615 RepID=L2GMF4_VITCO|nr:uncharacterized protein VICG_00922 [Vittaforma corneae ATCC 50505]ELA42073.1 hypothetical protein VICG_00922 [Vittaforma corneae ATCC 50505]